MQRNLFSYIWRYSRPEQLVTLMLVVFAQVFYFLSLSVPKSIVNNGITGLAFKDHPTIPFLVCELDLSAILGGQALTALIFIMMQNFMLSVIVLVLLGVQMLIIPRLRRPVLVLGRQRQLSARLLAGRIAETADGHNEIHIHGAANFERADIS